MSVVSYMQFVYKLTSATSEQNTSSKWYFIVTTFKMFSGSVVKFVMQWSTFFFLISGGNKTDCKTESNRLDWGQ